MKKMNTSLKKVRDTRYFTVLMVLILLIIIASIISPKFLSLSNIVNVLRQVSISGILALGMTFILITGGIDLSVGAVIGVVSVVTAKMLSIGVNPFLCITASLAIGLIVGLVNGLGVAKFGIVAFIMTLGTQTMFRGVSLLIANGSPISWRDSGMKFEFMGKGELWGVPVPVFIFLIVLVISHIILEYTHYGRAVYAIGDSRETARLSGINVVKTEIITYILCSSLAVLSALVLLSRLSVGEPQGGEGSELDAIAMSVIGGTSTAGGTGGVVGTFIGAALLSVLSVLLNLMGVSPFVQQIAKGIVILFAVFIDSRNKK